MNPLLEPPPLLEKSNNILQGAKPTPKNHDVLKDQVVEQPKKIKKARTAKQIEALRRAREKRKEKLLTIKSVKAPISPTKEIDEGQEFTQPKDEIRKFERVLNTQRDIQLAYMSTFPESGLYDFQYSTDGINTELSKRFGRIPPIFRTPENETSKHAKNAGWHDGVSPFIYKEASIKRNLRENPDDVPELFNIGHSTEPLIGQQESHLNNAGMKEYLKERHENPAPSPAFDLETYHNPSQVGGFPSIITQSIVGASKNILTSN